MILNKFITLFDIYLIPYSILHLILVCYVLTPSLHMWQSAGPWPNFKYSNTLEVGF